MNQSRWRRRLAWTAGIGVGVALLALVGIRAWLNHYLHSDEFRLRASRLVSDALGADGEFLPLHWTGNAAYTDGFAARGRLDSPVGQLRADQIRAEIDVTGWVRPGWRVSYLEIQRLHATLAGPPVMVPGGAAEPVAPQAATTARFALGPVTVQEANVQWPMGAAGTGAVRRARMVIERGAAGWELRVNGGDMVVPGWPGVRLEQGRVSSRDGVVFVSDGELRLVDGGTVTVAGQVGTEARLQAQFADVPVRNWAPPDWRASVAGRASGTARVRGTVAEWPAMTVVGEVTVTGGKLEALPVLDRIALFTQTEQFRSVPLRTARATVTWAGERLTVTELVMESPGLLRVEGGAVVEREVMDGTFEVGVAAATLRWLPGARTQVFTVERDGFLWTTVKVRGPLRGLEEDLSARLVAAAGKELIDGAGNLLEQGVKGFFDLLGRPGR